MNSNIITQLEKAIHDSLNSQQETISFLLKKQRQLFIINAILAVFLLLNFYSDFHLSATQLKNALDFHTSSVLQ